VTVFDRIASITSRRPWRVLVVTVVAFVASLVLGTPVAGLLNSDSDSFSDNSSESAEAAERLEQATGEASTPDLVALVDRSERGALREVRKALTATPEVARVVGGRGAQFTSHDGDQVYVAAVFGADADADHATEELRDQLGRIDGVLVGGQIPAYQEVNENVESDLVRAELLAFPLLFLVSLWVFRSAVAALLPLLVGGLTIVASMVLLRAVNEGLEISIFALNLVTGLGLGLSIDYSLFLVSRFREEMARVGAGAEAIRTTVLTAGRTVAYSAVTVAGAGVALLVFPLRFLYSMGIGVVIVSLLAAAVSLLVLPALFAVLGERVNALSPQRWRQALDAEARAERTGFWYRWSGFVMRRPLPIALLGTVLLLGLGAPFLGIKFTGVDASVLPEGSEALHVDAVLREEFPGGDSSPAYVAVEAPRSAAADVQAYAGDLRDLDHVAAVTPPAYVGDETWRLDVVADDRALAESTVDLVRDIRQVDTALTTYVGGQSADHVDQLRALADGMLPALAILAVLTIIALFLMTGSIVLPVKALLMNLLTVSATFGILVLVFQHGRLEGPLDYASQGALESTQPVFLFAIVFGLSTDYAVFLLTRIKEARDAGASDRESVALGLQRTGRIVTAAALLFAIAMGAFGTSQIVFIKELGIGTALAVLIDATLVRALLVPSLMAMLGRRNWWAPAPLRRLHDRVGLAH
jgi:uncharacterized membrane protein YdfJ with MMPL/SSD domain